MKEKEEESENGGDRYEIRIGGSMSGQAAAGKNIRQRQTVVPAGGGLSPEETARLRQLVDQLKLKIEAEAPDEKKQAALERAAELGEELASPEPSLSTLAYIKRWFGKNIPALAGAVTGLIIHPLVGKLVETAGEGLSERLRQMMDAEP